ncbi:MAG: paraquat-inducible protein A [Saprospiraceae bacterium]|nr:paraquat-inducible protein A [Lewinella sp.]
MHLSRSFLLINLFFLLAGGLISYQFIHYAKDIQHSREQLAATLHFEKRLLDFEEWFEGEGWQKKREIVAGHKAALKAPQQRALQWSLGFVALAGLYLFLGFREQRRRDDPRIGSATIIITAIICLMNGILAPMLEIAAFQEDLSIPIRVKTGFLSMKIDYTQTFPGEMYFYYQSKSVVELIGLLFRQNNFVVGIAILLFSVLIPLGKNGISLAGLIRNRLPESRAWRWLLLRSGKWSMADVFVVALFLGFLAFQNMQTGIQTESHLLIGFYFFLAYVLLAIWASVRVDRNMIMGKRDDEETQ